MGKDKTAPLTFILSRKGREESGKFFSKLPPHLLNIPKFVIIKKRL
jgi:hypothetical protein